MALNLASGLSKYLTYYDSLKYTREQVKQLMDDCTIKAAKFFALSIFIKIK